MREYIKDGMKLFNGDCMVGMAQYPDNYFDLAIVDPPYGINLANMNMGAGKSPKSTKIENRQWEAKDWDLSIPDDSYFKELIRVSKNQIIWGGNYFDLGVCGKYIIWDKEIPLGLSFSDCEYAHTSFNGANKMFRYSAYLDKSNKMHPTQKPVKLYSWLLQNYSSPEHKILDTHLGSASHAIAWHYFQKGGEFVGFELDEEYFDKSIKRIEQETAQLSMF